MSFAGSRGPGRPFVAAVAGAALTATAMLIGAALIEGGAAPLDEVPVLLALVLSGAALIIGVAAVLVGLPLTLLLDQARAEEAWVYPAAGLIAGGLILILFERLLSPPGGTSIPSLIVEVAPFGAVPGGVCGALWWRLYRRHVQEER
jgi:hypothetical protein